MNEILTLKLEIQSPCMYSKLLAILNILVFRFAGSSSFKVHLKTHNGEKSYMCKFCGKLYAQAHMLQQHLNTHTISKSEIEKVETIHVTELL